MAFLLGCASSASRDSGAGTIAQDCDGGADAGALKGPLRFKQPTDWLDGGTVSVRSVWNPSAFSHSRCRVMSSGRLLVNSQSAAFPMERVLMFVSQDAGVEILWPDTRGGIVTDMNESVSWCEGDPSRVIGVRCQRRLIDGSIELAAERFFDVMSWTASGFVSGAVRKSAPGRWRSVWYPDAGVWEQPSEPLVFHFAVRLHESGIGTGQFTRSDGGLAAFLFDDGQVFDLEPSSSASSSGGMDLNGSGLVVGQRFVGGANAGAVFWGNETQTLPRRRGYSADLRDVNENGLAVGQERGDAKDFALLWYRGTTFYLNDLVDAGVGCSYSMAESVNDSNSVAVLRQCGTEIRDCVRVDLELGR